MPEITVCPDCEKRLKVPDTLIGKKVRCPGCAKMFVAKAAGAEDDEEIVEAEVEDDTPPPAKKPARSAAIAEKPAAGRRRRDEDDESGIATAPRPKGRRDRDDDEDDEDDDKPRMRRRGRDDDDEDDEDHPVRKRRRYPEDDEDDDEDDDEGRGRNRHAGGWSGTKTGINLTVIGGWGVLLGLSLMVALSGLMMTMGGAMFAGAVNAGNAAGAAGMLRGMMGGGMLAVVGMIGVIGLIGISGLLVVIGQCMCLQVPRLGSSSTGTMIVGCVICLFASIVVNVLGSVVPISGILAILVTLVAAALSFASFMFWLSFLQGVCLDLKDRGNAETVGSYRTWVFIMIGASFGVGLLVAVLFMISIIAGGILAIIAYIGMGIAQLVMVIWLLFIEQAVRDTIIRRVKM